MDQYKHYQRFAELFRYPDKDLANHAIACRDTTIVNYPGTEDKIGKFTDFVLSNSLSEIEEVFMQTFHVQAICYLDLGYVMFGEDYKRGEFLVNMKLEQQVAGNDCGTELPDNLVNVLVLLAKHPDMEFIEELSARIVIPCIKKMLAEFDASRITLKMEILKKKHKALLQFNPDYGNIYQEALKALLVVLEKDFEGIHIEGTIIPSFNVNPFINNCGSCSLNKQPVSR